MNYQMKLIIMMININELDEKTIRKNISIITQNPYIFNMSIKDNLKLVKPNATQKEIQETIEHISSDYTIIIIAHRLSTIINCNPIYILKNGKNIDKGSHRELLNRNKEYNKLYKNENK